MMTSQEINDYLTAFNINSYNRTQIGNSKQIIITIYEFLNKLNIKKDNIDTIISDIAYLNKDKTNIALYLELLSKSLGFAHSYDLKEVLRTTKEIHDIYYNSSALVPLEEYIHDTSDDRIRKLFLNRNSKYLLKSFESNEALIAISDLKLASAITLEQKEYKEFLSYIDEFEKFQDYYSPLLVFQTYNKVRKNLKVSKRLFWDIFFGNEYVVALTKHNMPIKDIFKKNIYSNYKKKKKSSKGISIQLDLFSTLEELPEVPHYIKDELTTFQLCTIFNSKQLPDYNDEKEFLLYYLKLVKGKETISLPKSNKSIPAYRYNLN